MAWVFSLSTICLKMAYKNDIIDALGRLIPRGDVIVILARVEHNETKVIVHNNFLLIFSKSNIC